MYLKWGTVGEGEEGMGSKWFTANLGSEWTGSHHDAKEGFHVSREGVQGQGGISRQRGL
jgi:hypothetical protein